MVALLDSGSILTGLVGWLRHGGANSWRGPSAVDETSTPGCEGSSGFQGVGRLVGAETPALGLLWALQAAMVGADGLGGEQLGEQA